MDRNVNTDLSRPKLKLIGPSKVICMRSQGGYLHIRRSGGLDLTSSLEAKFGAGSGQVHKIRGKTWEILLPQDTKVGKKIRILGSNLKFRGQNLGYLSPIFLEANFGAKPPPTS